MKEKTKKRENTGNGKTMPGADKHTHYIINIIENQIQF